MRCGGTVRAGGSNRQALATSPSHAPRLAGARGARDGLQLRHQKQLRQRVHGLLRAQHLGQALVTHAHPLPPRAPGLRPAPPALPAGA